MTLSNQTSRCICKCIRMSFDWLADDCPTLKAGLVAFGSSSGSISVFLPFLIFREGPGSECIPSGSAHELQPHARLDICDYGKI